MYISVAALMRPSQGGVMDSVLSALMRSRSKSIGVLLRETADLRDRASKSRVPAAQAALESALRVKEMRLARLQEELAGLQSEADRQVELPGQDFMAPAAPAGVPTGVPAVGPTVRKKP